MRKEALPPSQAEGGGYGALDYVACNLLPPHPEVHGSVAGPTRFINVISYRGSTEKYTILVCQKETVLMHEISFDSSHIFDVITSLASVC
jgi:hypothetical protein